VGINKNITVEQNFGNYITADFSVFKISYDSMKFKSAEHIGV
jgi:hypothetical protein